MLSMIYFPPLEVMKVTSPFGMRVDPLNKGVMRFHNGVDLRAGIGTSVFACTDGIVTVWSDPILGFAALLWSGEIAWGFAHLHAMPCAGTVKTGEQFARTGRTGRVTGPHLHFECLNLVHGVWINVDPMLHF